MIAAQAIRLREAVLALLSGPDDDARAAWRALGPTSPTAWEFFFRAERCALAIKSRLSACGLTPELAPDIEKVIRVRAMQELQRVLSAQAQLRWIANVAREHEWKVIVLKGGTMLLNGGHLDLHDIDVLTLPGIDATLTDRLDNAGYSAVGESGPWHHLAPRHVENAVAIEVHHRVKDIVDTPALFDRAVEVKKTAGLWQLAPKDHLWHLLIHATIQHTDRRGCIRDTILIANAIDACSEDDVRTVTAQIATQREPAVLHAMLSLAQSFRDRRPVADPFAEVALRKYVFYEQCGARVTNVRGRAARFICGNRSFIGAIRMDLALPTDVPSELDVFNHRNRVPRFAAHVARQGLRMGRLGLVAYFAVQNALATKRVSRQLRRTS